jgi:hypothetical protein
MNYIRLLIDALFFTPLLAVILYEDIGLLVSEWTKRAVEFIDPILLMVWITILVTIHVLSNFIGRFLR